MRLGLQDHKAAMVMVWYEALVAMFMLSVWLLVIGLHWWVAPKTKCKSITPALNLTLLEQCAIPKTIDSAHIHGILEVMILQIGLLLSMCSACFVLKWFSFHLPIVLTYQLVSSTTFKDKTWYVVFSRGCECKGTIIEMSSKSKSCYNWPDYAVRSSLEAC